MHDGTIRLKLQLKERKMLGRRSWELEMKTQGQGVWEVYKKEEKG